jgi:hypothetical protein
MERDNPFARTKVVVATFDTPHEAELARIHLESLNIGATVRDDTLIGLAQIYAGAFGGVKLLTDADDAEEAAQLVKRLRGKKRKKNKGELADDVARRAFRAAVIGIFLCPGPAHAYSLVLINGLKDSRMTPAGKRNLHAATIISSLVLFGYFLLLLRALLLSRA